MNVFIDYDNIERPERSKGVKTVLFRIADVLCQHLAAPPQRLAMRLYGGWYDLTNPTRYAQTIATELLNCFPTKFSPVSAANRTAVIVAAELAYSQLADPGTHLLNTYREKGCPRGLKATLPVSCASAPGSSACGLRHLPEFLRGKRCPERGCGTVLLEDVVFRGEQKLVDVMLASDLLYSAAQSPSEPLAVVSSDQDLWPAIKQACLMSPHLLHVQTSASKATPSYYKLSTPSYKEVSL